MTRRKLFHLFLGTTLAAGMVSATAVAGETYDRIKKTGVINMGFANEAPYSYKEPDGSLAGADYDLAREILTQIGVKKIDGVAMKFGSLIPGLKAKRFDIVVAGMYVRPARCKQVAFSEPNIQVPDALVVPKGNPKNLHSYDDVIKSGAVVAGVQGGASVKNAVKAGIPKERVKEFPDFSELVGAVKSGRIDGAVQTAITAQKSVAADGGKNLERAWPWTPPVFDGKPAINYTAFGFRLEDQDLRADFNKAYMAFRNSAAHVAIMEKYGLSKGEIPPESVTTANLCSP